MSQTYTLNGYVSRLEADILDTSMFAGYAGVSGLRYMEVTTRGATHRFEVVGEEPKLGTPVTITVVVG